MRKLLLALGLAALPAAAHAGDDAQTAACPVEQAVYEMITFDGDGEFRARFIPARNHASIASDLYLRLTTPLRDYWFKFNVSQGYSGISLFPVTDPYAEEAEENGPHDLLGEPFGDNPHAVADRAILSSLRFYVLDENLVFLHEPPMSGDEAPPYIMMPEIGLALWYYPDALSGDMAGARDPMPRGIFRPAECLSEPPPPAYP